MPQVQVMWFLSANSCVLVIYCVL